MRDGTPPSLQVKSILQRALAEGANVGARDGAGTPRRAFSDVLAAAVWRGRPVTASGASWPGRRPASMLGGAESWTAGRTDQLSNDWAADLVSLTLARHLAASRRRQGGPSASLTVAAQSGESASANGLRVPSVPNGLGPLLAEASQQYSLEPALLAAVIEVESGFNPNAVSPAGAKGLMQLMDATARGLGVTDSYDPQQNILGGARFLRQLLDRYKGDIRLALAAYNAGSGTVERYGGIPPYPETQRFVSKVLESAARFGRHTNSTASTTS